MTLAVLSESQADEAAIRILVNGILGRETHPVVGLPLRSRGWPSVLNVLPSVLKHLYYRTDAEAFVVVVDSNTSPVHQIGHNLPAAALDGCRFCQLQQAIEQVQSQFAQVHARPRIETAVGLAVPAMEAWYLCGRDARVSEATWANALQSGTFPYTKSTLKESVYDTDRPSLQHETARSVEEARRLAANLHLLETLFPNGFGVLARQIRDW